MKILERAKLCDFAIKDISLFNKESFIEKMKSYKSIVSILDIAGCAQLRKIGVNINQLISLCNTYSSVDMICQIQEKLIENLEELKSIEAFLRRERDKQK